MLKSGCFLVVLAAVAILTNSMFEGANYLFLAKTAEAASILDILPKNYLLRLTIMAVVITALFYLAYLPWQFIDRKRRLQEQAEAR